MKADKTKHFGRHGIVNEPPSGRPRFACERNSRASEVQLFRYRDEAASFGRLNAITWGAAIASERAPCARARCISRRTREKVFLRSVEVLGT